MTHLKLALKPSSAHLLFLPEGLKGELPAGECTLLPVLYSHLAPHYNQSPKLGYLTLNVRIKKYNQLACLHWIIPGLERLTIKDVALVDCSHFGPHNRDNLAQSTTCRRTCTLRQMCNIKEVYGHEVDPSHLTYQVSVRHEDLSKCHYN